MGDLTKNLSRHEFKCSCGCGLDTIDFAVVEALQNACDYFLTKKGGRITIRITGGNRCKTHNDNLRKSWVESGGKRGANTSANSQHIHCRAADFKIYHNGNQIPEPEVYIYYEENHTNFSIGRYNNRNHIDSRTDGGRRWGRGA